MKTLTEVDSVTVDSPSAGKVTVVFTYADQTFTQPAQATTIGEFPSNPNWSRGHRITDLAHFVLRNGASSVAMLISKLAKIAIALEPTLSWAPLIATQPSAATCTGNVSASGTLTGSNTTNVSDGDTVTIASVTYRFKNTLAQAYDVKIGGSGNSDTSLANLIKAINASGTPGTEYFAGTAIHPSVTAAVSVTANAFAVTAKSSGLTANSIVTTETSSVLSWGAVTLTGGTDHAATISVVAGVTETTMGYQWQYSSDGGTTWVNATGTVSGTAYTNSTTATLTCTPTTTGQTGKLHRCVLTNLSGTKNTSSVSLTIA